MCGRRWTMLGIEGRDGDGDWHHRHCWTMGLGRWSGPLSMLGVAGVVISDGHHRHRWMMGWQVVIIGGWVSLSDVGTAGHPCHQWWGWGTVLSLDVVAIIVGTGCGLSAEAVVNGMGTGMGLDWLTSSVQTDANTLSASLITNQHVCTQHWPQPPAFCGDNEHHRRRRQRAPPPARQQRQWASPPSTWWSHP